MHKVSDPSLAFSLYASTVATMAMSVLQKDGRVDQVQMDHLIESLEACREFVGDNEALKMHADLLEDILKSSS